MVSKICTLIIAFSVLLPPLVFARKTTAVVIHISGDAQISMARDKNFKRLKLGMRVKGGQIIRCGSKSKLKIVYPSGETIFVGENTQVTLPRSQQMSKKPVSLLFLLYGRIRMLVSATESAQERFHIKTPTALSGVRGTDLFVSHGPEVGTHVAVLHGSVEVVSPRHTAVIESGRKLVLHDKVKEVSLTKAHLNEIHKHTSHGIKIQKEYNDLDKSSKKLLLSHFPHDLHESMSGQKIHEAYLSHLLERSAK